jgi:serine protease Do
MTVWSLIMVLSRFRTSPKAVSVAVLASFLGLAAPIAVIASTTVAFARGPEPLSDLAEQVMDSVVNISATTTIEAKPSLRDRLPNMPQGTPLDDLFEEFFKRTPGNNSEARRSNSLGSGFVIDASGIVVTNNHVIGEATEISVLFSDGTRLKAEVVGRDPKVDLAVLRVKPDKPLKAVKFGDSEKLRLGEWVMAIGNPFGLGGSLSQGIVSARGRNIESGPYDSFIQTDAAINKGNSGGPLFNMNGEVVGINTAILSPSGGSVGIGFAIPASLASPVVAQLREFGETRRGWLGVRIQNVDDATAEALGIGSARGALIAGIDDKGPARPGGLEVGDVIIRFDGVEIKQSRDLPRTVANTPVGKKVDVILVRKGKELTKSVTLGRLEDGEKQETAAASATAVEGEQNAVRQALKIDVSPLTADLRRRLNVKEDVKGVVVTKVDASSNAAEKRLQAGDLIVEAGREPVTSVADLVKIVEAHKKDKKKSILLLVTNPQNARAAERFVGVTLE